MKKLELIKDFGQTVNAYVSRTHGNLGMSHKFWMMSAKKEWHMCDWFTPQSLDHLIKGDRRISHRDMQAGYP